MSGASAGASGRLARARLALEGLSIGDAFGERFFVGPHVVAALVSRRSLPEAPWGWTDDTAMALSVHGVLRDRGGIDRDALARDFARRYAADPSRGYGGTAHRILSAIGSGIPWHVAARDAFGGEGSMGNGAAMRVAPIGGYFADDLDAVVLHARASAEPTHAHPDGQAGAIAVALAAAVAARMHQGTCERTGEALFREVLGRTPAGLTRDGIESAAHLSPAAAPLAAAAALGNGARVVSFDTVPFSLWCAARHLDRFEDAMWTTVSGLGDRDTTCAIVGGIVALAVGREGIPDTFAAAREAIDAPLAG